MFWLENDRRKVRKVMRAAVPFLLLATSLLSQAFVLPLVNKPTATSVVVRSSPGSDENIASKFVSDIEKERADAVAKIEELIKGNKVVLFMKGTKLFPMCGFSNTAVQVLRALDAEFETFDVLSDQVVREEIKSYSAWPTIPQCYIAGEFVGGSDILIEMYQNGELLKQLQAAGATKQ